MRFSGIMLVLLLLAIPWRLQASADWLALDGGCGANVEQLAERIERELAGVRPAALSLAIELATGARVRGRLRVLENTRVVGEKQVEARTCDEALDLLSAIAALALSSFPAAEAEHVVAQEHAPAKASAAREWRPTAFRTTPEARRDGDAHAHSAAQRWRVLASAGVSLGAGTPTTLLLAGGAAATLGRGELRLMGRYGAPSTTEEVEAAFRSLRRDFGSAALDYCHGLNRSRWLSLCAGLEALTRRERRTDVGTNGRVEHTRRSSLLGPTFGLAFVLRRLVAQPQLELSALVPVWGAPPGFGFRAALGGGVPF